MATCDFTLILILPKHDHKSRGGKKIVFFLLISRQICSRVESKQQLSQRFESLRKGLKNITRHEVIHLCAILYVIVFF